MGVSSSHQGGRSSVHLFQNLVHQRAASVSSRQSGGKRVPVPSRFPAQCGQCIFTSASSKGLCCLELPDRWNSWPWGLYHSLGGFLCGCLENIVPRLKIKFSIGIKTNQNLDISGVCLGGSAGASSNWSTELWCRAVLSVLRAGLARRFWGAGGPSAGQEEGPSLCWGKLGHFLPVSQNGAEGDAALMGRPRSQAGVRVPGVECWLCPSPPA